MTIEKTYQPAAVEGRIYAEWEAAGAFRAGRPERANAEPYCIVIPPPNVTGSLHMGHALNNTLQDILCRFERMRGKDVLWQPGTDHAGIATQAVVERQLMERQLPGSREMGREAFIERVWEWKAESGGTIIGQLKRLGASCDWSRERFTMGERSDPNDQMVKAVMKAFVDLYDHERDGRRLIYRDKRIVNWDPQLETAISDLEVQQIETDGSLWHIKYPIEQDSEFVVVATTRPETMLGDVAVAIHPDNERLKHLVGKYAILPLVGRRIPIIADTYADPEKGSGAVKITPAHDFNDFEVWRRHKDKELRGYKPINILNRKAQLFLYGNFDFKSNILDRFIDQIDQTTHDLDGEDRFVARKRIVAALEANNFLLKAEKHRHAVPHGDRSGAVIEPFLTDQWYVDAKTLAQPAIEAVRAGRTTFVPGQWEATFFNWMENIQPWCISRQIWWGHQIPVWYGPYVENEKLHYEPEDGGKNRFFAAESETEAINKAKSVYQRPVVVLSSWRDLTRTDVLEQMVADNKTVFIWRDEDVLDTWFSSALWPFSTLGWPDQTPELKRYYPTSVLVTGFDIIFFWVARMMMMGLHFMKNAPFPVVYIHALVRDATGAKMSKSKGNVIDPLALIDEYGADALRFTLAAMAAQGRDIKLSGERVAGYRNFATKLWNAARFAEMNESLAVARFDPSSVRELVNQWIVSQLGDALGRIEIALDDYRFNDAANTAYQFVWNLYCDWYLELVKPIFVGIDEKAKRETRATVAYVRDEILKILHPFMPFITEELWQVSEASREERILALAAWPNEQPHFPEAHEELGWLIELVSAVRSVRTEMNVPAGSLIQIEFIGASDTTRKRAQVWDSAFNRLARISGSIFSDKVRPGSIQLVVGGEIVALQLQGLIDLAAESARLGKEMAKADADIARVDAKLGNANFVARAPEEVVEEEKEKREEARARKAKIAEALERLKGAA